MMHGHPPQQPPHHMGHPPPPPPHLTHLTSVPPPNVPPQGAMPQPRDHLGPRINHRHHHHPRVSASGDQHHQQQTTLPHMAPLQHHGGSRKPQHHHYNNNGLVSGGVKQHHHSSGGGMGHPGKSLPYRDSSHQQQHNHHSSGGGHHGHHSNVAGIPVVSAAGPGGAKTRMIPSHEPKTIHNHSNVAPPATTTPTVTVVHQTESVHLSGAPVPVSNNNTSGSGTVNNNSNTASAVASIPNGTSSGSGGVGGASGSVPVPAGTLPPASDGSGGGGNNQIDSQTQQQQTLPQQQMSQLLSSVPETLANNKEKTPMCLVNELARYNKIQHQYRLTGESGPAHKKRFTVTLKLGDEEYTAEGASIKKAQHCAAHEAIGATKYKHPPAKTNRIKPGGKPGVGNITPTVELNALAMKRGEPTVYETEQVVTAAVPHKYSGTTGHHHPPPGGLSAPGAAGQNFFSAPPPNSHYGGGGGYHRGNGGAIYSNPPPGGVRYGVPPPYNRRNPMGGGGKSDYNPRGYLYNHHMPPMAHQVPELYKVTLHVGERTFLGEGNTLQAARHDAAARALEVLKPLTPDTPNSLSGNCPDTSIDSDDPNSELKSPISLVHELALKRKLTVQFEVHGEKGPPHMKVFTTLCKVGTIVTEGEGNGKKLSKKRAAEKMLDELRKLPPASPEKVVRTPLKQKRKLPLPKKKTRNLIKESGDDDPLDMVNPISRLMQIQQARKEKEPEYKLLEERGMARRREFVMEVTASGKTATGIGPTKKLAKKEAAENLLLLLGYGKSTVANSSVSPNKENMSGSANDAGEKAGRKVSFNEAKHGGSAGRQIVPGVLQLNSGISNKSNSGGQSGKEVSQDAIDGPESTTSGSTAKAPASVSKPSNATASADTGSTPANTNTTTSSSNPDVGRKKEQLMYLAQLLKFDVMFSDFPKGNHGEFLTLVTLSTDPPQLCHGSGASLEESHDEAARGALDILSKIGLDNVKPKGTATAGGGSGDENNDADELQQGPSQRDVRDMQLYRSVVDGIWTQLILLEQQFEAKYHARQ